MGVAHDLESLELGALSCGRYPERLSRLRLQVVDLVLVDDKDRASQLEVVLELGVGPFENLVLLLELVQDVSARLLDDASPLSEEGEVLAGALAERR